MLMFSLQVTAVPNVTYLLTNGAPSGGIVVTGESVFIGQLSGSVKEYGIGNASVLYTYASTGFNVNSLALATSSGGVLSIMQCGTNSGGTVYTWRTSGSAITLNGCYRNVGDPS